MSGIEVPLSLGLRAAALGLVQPNDANTHELGLADSLCSQKSENQPAMLWAIRYSLGDKNAADMWREYFKRSHLTWMGYELNSLIYFRMTLLSVAQVAKVSAARSDDTDIHAEAIAWLWVHFALSILTETSTADGKIILASCRAAGHSPSSVWRTWLLALAEGDPSMRKKAEAQGKEENLAMPHQWEWDTALALTSTLEAGLPGDLRGALDSYTPAVPLHIYRSDSGVASWLDIDPNSNTPAHQAGIWDTAQGEVWAPAGGGNRVREKHNPARVERRGDSLYYYTAPEDEGGRLYPDQVIALPDDGLGDEFVWGTATVQQGTQQTPQVPGQKTTNIPPVPSSLSSSVLARITSQIESLRLSGHDAGRQLQIISILRTLPPPTSSQLLALADRVQEFGIGSGQPQKAVQREIVQKLRDLAAHS